MSLKEKKSGLEIKKLATMAVFAALSIVLVLIVHFPIFPAVGFLEYDPADIPILLATFMYGPVSGLVLTVVVSVLQGLTVSALSGVYGIIMHIIATGAYFIAAGLIYKKVHNIKGAVFSLVAGTGARVLVMIPANLFITPYFMGVPVSMVVSLLGFIVAFNAIVAAANGIITFVIYKPLRKLLK